MSEPSQVVRSDERGRPAGPSTPGMERSGAFSSADRWVGYVVTQPGVRSGWHHHGEMDTYVYVVRGELELEFGPGGRELVHAREGDFALIPHRTIHREGTPAKLPAEAVIVRIGGGQPVFNVDGPDPDH